ncbi:hypothetical protein MHB77_32485 [Paenibacillus sp. FSL K6-3166]|uniref:hypothetical protein n=1 Tax=unclassified Paenibacillus TaxID=185978 RepID=UPI000B9FB30B|nr:hypothetical protein [Paenibacillus sp. VTT E-133291]OZQ84682.1 hypothetical protein CA598_23085 [Paenibacillus sp. VTT E-133291]
MKNFYEIRGDTTAIFLSSPKYGSMETLIATADLPRAQEYEGTWFPNWNRKTVSFYVKGKYRKPDGTYTTIALHRWLFDLSTGKGSVDHLMHDTLDNCRWALSVGTQADNSRNCRVNRRNRSGFSGVCWNARLLKWKAHIRYNYELRHLGYFDSKEEAISARRMAEKELFGGNTKIA